MKLLTGLPATYQIVKEIIFNQCNRCTTSPCRNYTTRSCSCTKWKYWCNRKCWWNYNFQRFIFRARWTWSVQEIWTAKWWYQKNRIRHLLVLFKEGSPTAKLLSETKSHEVSQNWPSRNSCTSQYGRSPTAPQEGSCCRCYANDSSSQHLDHLLEH